jgi:hypothetical protein
MIADVDENCVAAASSVVVHFIFAAILGQP